MTKNQASKIHVGDKVRSASLGIGTEHVVDDIVNDGPRRPYFQVAGRLLSYRDVTYATYRMLNTNRSGANGTPESRADLKRERDRRYSAERREAASK